MIISIVDELIIILLPWREGWEDYPSMQPKKNDARHMHANKQRTHANHGRMQIEKKEPLGSKSGKICIFFSFFFFVPSLTRGVSSGFC